MKNCSCGHPLVNSYYLTLSGQLYKSCALCSKVAGEHVFHKLASFGLWHVHPEHKEPFPQSECITAYRARTESTTVVEPSTMTHEALVEAMPSLPARGLKCSTCKQTPRGRDHELIEPLYEEARVIAAEVLSGDRPVGRQAGSSKRDARRAYTFSRPLADQIAEDRANPVPRPPAVIRRRKPEEARS